MRHQLYEGGSDEEVIQVFKQTFSESEGAEEGNRIGTLVSKLLKDTPPKYREVFVSTQDEQINGCVIFSILCFDEKVINVRLLSPMAVLPEFQGSGIGQALIKYAHSFLKGADVKIVITYGDINFYSRVGYQPISEDVIKAPQKLTYPEGWIAQSLTDDPIEPIADSTHCVEALNDPVYW